MRMYNGYPKGGVTVTINIKIHMLFPTVKKLTAAQS